MPTLPAPASTIVSSDITTNTTWSKDQSPYVVTTDVTVQSGVVLTVEPGVEVQFEQNAGLTANGTSSQSPDPDESDPNRNKTTSLIHRGSGGGHGMPIRAWRAMPALSRATRSGSRPG